MTFHHLKPGDTAIRMLGGSIPMLVKVVEVLPDRIRCDVAEGPVITDGNYWEFDRATGAEIDDELGWGPAHGVTGSFLKGTNDGL